MRQAGGEHPCVTQGRETAPTRSRKSPAWRTHTAADGAWLARRRLSIADSSCRTWGGFPPRGSLHQRPRARCIRAAHGALSADVNTDRRTPPDTLGAGRHERALFRLQHGVGRGTGLKPVNAGAFHCSPQRRAIRTARAAPCAETSPRWSTAGYHTLNAASFEKDSLPEALARRLPHYPVPAAVIGRLAVDYRSQGRGLVEILSLDALRRVVRASNAIGIYVTVDNAKNDRARACYARYGCKPFPIIPRYLFLLLRTFEQLGLADSTRRTATGAPIRTSGCSAPSARRRARRGRVPRRA